MEINVFNVRNTEVNNVQVKTDTQRKVAQKTFQTMEKTNKTIKQTGTKKEGIVFGIINSINTKVMVAINHTSPEDINAIIHLFNNVLFFFSFVRDCNSFSVLKSVETRSDKLTLNNSESCTKTITSGIASPLSHLEIALSL